MVPVRGKEALNLMGVETTANPKTLGLPKIYNQKALVHWKDAVYKSQPNFDDRSPVSNWLLTIRNFIDTCRINNLNLYDLDFIKNRNDHIDSTIGNSRLAIARELAANGFLSKVKIVRTSRKSAVIGDKCFSVVNAVFVPWDPTLPEYLMSRGFVNTKGILVKQVSMSCTIRVNFSKNLLSIEIDTKIPFLVKPHKASKRSISIYLGTRLLELSIKFPISNTKL